jgi:ribosomal protein L34E
MDRVSPDPTADALSDDILSGMHEWRLQHPDATLTEIEQALDQRWYRLRARMLQDLALEREAANWQAKTADRPTCPDCGRTLIRRGRQPRQLKTHGGHELTLTRSYGYCPSCKKGLFPPR